VKNISVISNISIISIGTLGVLHGTSCCNTYLIRNQHYGEILYRKSMYHAVGTKSQIHINYDHVKKWLFLAALLSMVEKNQTNKKPL
jgi:hypothetical protein